MSKNNTLKTASVLAFERKLDPSDALFHAGNWPRKPKDAKEDEVWFWQQAQQQKWHPVSVTEKSVRGTISNRLKNAKNASDPAKLDAEIEKANLQKVDIAALPPDCDTLKISFTLRVLSGVGEPSACNNIEYKNKLMQTVAQYVDTQGLQTLARAYAWNLANGRFLWRNRLGVEQIRVCINQWENNEVKASWKFDAKDFSLRKVSCPEKYQQVFDELGGKIAGALSGEQYLLLEVTALVYIGRGQEVYPSQELIMEKGKGNGQKSKTLYQVNGVAGMHSQKVGNAIRTIDVWHPSYEEIGPIAVEPYGSVTSLGKACRQPKENQDFYTLLDNWILKDRPPLAEQQHYVIACLIRGGVFGDSEKE